MSRKVLITRPVEDASPLKARLAVMGLETLENPILKIVYNDEKSISLDGVQAILFTSANGVRSFTRCDDNRSLPVLTVGNASARAAEEAGFQQVESADGNVDALAALINKRLDPKKERSFMLRLRGLPVISRNHWRKAVLMSGGRFCIQPKSRNS